MNEELHRIMETHQHGAFRVVSNLVIESLRYPDIVVNALRKEALEKSGLPPNEIIFTEHLIDESDETKIIVVTADSKEHYAELPPDH
ncbi:hypothetical protein RB620_04455 [Paenibacillus sp. LHD-117]|uniref:hypothetical protein n=1 Tax=Paenibacillus sp. LHD-117 TaxID=3071412 RepID=UPI0027E0846C|nr:hypothetical protein [Paenibacillus sp. LHD-117]MDQ6418684.1 hypothetical protein [Paenibacillus sp. LHD-117]